MLFFICSEYLGISDNEIADLLSFCTKQLYLTISYHNITHSRFMAFLKSLIVISEKLNILIYLVRVRYPKKKRSYGVFHIPQHSQAHNL